MLRLARCFVLVGALGTTAACSKEDEKKLSFSTQLRSAGTASLGLRHGWGLATLTSDFLANSSVTVESFEVPIGRINLTAGDTGSGYTNASPNFYSCSGSANADCMVDVVNTTIDDLLQGNPGDDEVTFESEQTYTGTAVELCAEGSGGSGTTFKAKLKASAALGGATYYTNAASGTSTTGPAEAIELEMPCGGLNTDLVAPVTVTPDSSVSLVFWADPAGSVLLTNNGPLVNTNCASDTPGTVTFCASHPAVFGTAVAGAATAERYYLDVTSPANYGDVLATVISDAAGTPFGASLTQIYTNTAGEQKTMHTSQLVFSSVKLDGGKYDFMYLSSGSSEDTILSGLPKDGAGTGLKMTKLVDTEMTMNSTKL